MDNMTRDTVYIHLPNIYILGTVTIRKITELYGN